MPRRARIVLPQVPHHITQRGNYQNCMFFDDKDREYFLFKLDYYARRNGLAIAAYCLMDNHTHLSVIPDSAESLNYTLKPLHMCYSQYLNKKFKRKGINWQGRYFSSSMDISYAWTTFQYIALNPVRAGKVVHPGQYLWSSAACHLGNKEDNILTANSKWLEMASSAVKEIATGTPSLESVGRFNFIEKTLHTNLPLGTEEFILEIEKQTKRYLRYRAVGRPRKLN